MAVYFARAKGLNRVKIGYTKSNDPSTRINQLKTSCADDLEIVHFVEDAPIAHEKALHLMFQKSHIKREWFHYRPQISDYLGDHNLDKPASHEGPKDYFSLQKKVDFALARMWSRAFMRDELSSSQHTLMTYALNHALTKGEDEVDFILGWCYREFDIHDKAPSEDELWYMGEIERRRNAKANGRRGQNLAVR